MTENKSRADGRDVMGQLLARMDKVVGELVHKHFCTPKTNFSTNINGLIIYYATSDCSVHRPDFDEET